MNNFTRFAAVIALATGLATPALAAPATFVVDPTHTFARFSYSHFGLSTQLSKFDKTTGTVVLDKAAKTASVDIVIDTTSVNTGYATFKSTKVDFAGDQPTAIHGNLTIKGVTKPVTFKVNHFVSMPHPMLKKDAIGADASAVIKRSEFNAGKYAPNVGDDVTISVALEAVKQ